jgi:hypothetical protein
VIYFCAQKNRRTAVLLAPGLNGIDYLEVAGPAGCGTQLRVTLLKDGRSLGLAAGNVAVSGTLPVNVVSIDPPSGDDPLLLTVQLDATGNFSPYTFAIVAGPGIDDPPDGVDPILSTVSFSFKAGCPSPADCLPSSCCPPPARPVPDINYLAKDYEGFRQLMLDRIAALSPAWTETHAADLGIAMVEVLAYAADHLSYQQDAVSTEAYIGTARSRISLRRHARLLDYSIGEGANARTWVFLQVRQPAVSVPKGTRFYVRSPGVSTVLAPHGAEAQLLLAAGQPVFESMEDVVLHEEQNEIDFYTWADGNCCLAPGATQATLEGQLTSLAAGTVLVFEEVLGPVTADPDDADPTHRWAVRLTSVRVNDHLGRPLRDPLNEQLVTRVEWDPADALPFPLCLSSTSQSSQRLTSVSVARGNIVPADHGSWVHREPLTAVPPPPAAALTTASCTCEDTSGVAPSRARYYPELSQAPLTFRASFDPCAPASAFTGFDPGTAKPEIRVRSDDGFIWSVVEDLMSSDATDRAFIPEIERDGSIFLRFGDGVYGMAPDPEQAFDCSYRIGNGTAGNVGREALAHVEIASDAISSCRNPLSAAGGTDPETMDHIRQWAPFAYQTQERCVTESDYGQAAVQAALIAQARGTLRWTGSWHTAFVSVDPVGPLTPQFLAQTGQRLDLLRMMGTDLAVEGAVIVGLKIALEICVAPDHFAGDIYTALMKVFVTGNQCSGQPGLLNAANFSFGETVYASPLVAAAQAVPGVVSATLSTFTRLDDPSFDGVENGYLTMGRLELPRCDNDPNQLDHGVFTLRMDGGK